MLNKIFLLLYMCTVVFYGMAFDLNLLVQQTLYWKLQHKFKQEATLGGFDVELFMDKMSDQS